MATPDSARPGFWSVRGPMSQRSYWVFAAIGLLAPLIAWWALAASGLVSKVFMPGPGQVLSRALVWFNSDNLTGDALISIYRVTAGWALSAVLALPIGLMIGTFRPVQALLEPLTDFIRYMPAVAFIPLVMLWIGIDESSKIAIIFIGTFFQMILMVAEDVRRVPAAQVEAAQTMGANSGLGYSILKAQRFLHTDKIFGGIIIIGLIGLITDQLFRLAHRKAFPWMYRKA